MRSIAIITGSRADYGIYTSVLEAIDRHPALKYELIITGMHLSKDFGNSVDEIRKDKRKIDARVPMLLYEDTLAGMVKNTGAAMIGIAKAFEKIKPDILLVVGDRGEQLAGAIAGAHMNIPVAHLHGGESSGSIDDSIRHAITKFAHIHLAATKLSRDKIINMGEEETRVFLVGSPGVDSVKKKCRMPRTEIADYFNFDPLKKIVLAVFHPVTTEFNINEANARLIADTIIELNEQVVWIYSNCDAGYKNMMESLEATIRKAKRGSKIKLHKTLPHEIFLSLMKQADVMIGNSSSGIIEAPSCETPYVLVGTRQNGREKAASILEVGYDKRQILQAVDKVLNDKEYADIVKNCEKPYDPFNDANAGERIAGILATVEITSELLAKRRALFSEKVF